MAPLGKSLVAMGLVIVVLGAAIWASSSIPFLGRLPGDIFIKRGNFSFYFPLTTCIILSILLSLLFILFRR
jgi:predicted phosphohydrolase